jgi:phosphatidate cytidylyltransferase
VKDLLIRTITGIGIVSLVVAGIMIHELSMLLLVGLIFLLGSLELSRMLSVKRIPYILMVIISGWSVLLFAYFLNRESIQTLWIIIPGIFFIPLLYMRARKPMPANRSALVFFLLAIFWLSLPLSLFMSLGWMEQTIVYNYKLPLILLVLTWVNDTFAYLTGTLFGKHQMTPVLSPGKTWEGFFGGLLFTILGGWLIHHISGTFSPGVWIMISALTVGFGLLGDLFESKLKRQYNVKNSGTLLPGHGGILDRFDSLLFAASAVYLLLLIIYKVQ